MSLDPLFNLIFFAGGVIGTWKTGKQLTQNSRTVNEIWLKRGGNAVEISLSSAFGKRKHSKIFLDIGELKPPPLFSDSWELKGDLFPHLTEGFEIPSENYFLPWVKYMGVIRKKIFIPKIYSYMDRELMVAVMNGYRIEAKV